MDQALYAEYLKSDEWADLRGRVMRRAQHWCEGCRNAVATEVHHLTYEHVGREFLFELVAICGDCHARWHDKEQRPAPAWTPRHTNRSAPAKESPAARANRDHLADLAARHRAKTMAEPPASPTPSMQARTLRAIAQAHHDAGNTEYAAVLTRQADALCPQERTDVPEAEHGAAA